VRRLSGIEHRTLTPVRRSLILAGGAALLVAAGAVTTSPAGAAPTCVPIDTTGQPTLGYNPGPQAPSYFAADFPAVQDHQLGYRAGGFGGLERHGKLHHTPVIFVHGNQADAQNWLSAMLQIEAAQPNGIYGALCGAPTLTGPAASCFP
jgi:hypothetical protein